MVQQDFLETIHLLLVQDAAVVATTSLLKFQ